MARAEFGKDRAVIDKAPGDAKFPVSFPRAVKIYRAYIAVKVSFKDVFAHPELSMHLGGRSLSGSQKMHCVFTDAHYRGDENPSAKVDLVRKRYSCYSGCGSGDVVWFVSKVLKLSTWEAIKKCNRMFKLDLFSPESIKSIFQVYLNKENLTRDAVAHPEFLEALEASDIRSRISTIYGEMVDYIVKLPKAFQEQYSSLIESIYREYDTQLTPTRAITGTEAELLLRKVEKWFENSYRSIEFLLEDWDSQTQYAKSVVSQVRFAGERL